MDEYLTKPMQLRLLGAALQRWLPGPRPEAVPSAQPSDQLAALDLSVLTELVGDDDEAVREFLADYWASARTLSDESRPAAARHDNAKVAACAHKLKSSSRSVGAMALGDACAALEDASLNASPADVARHYKRFEAALAAVAHRLALHTAAEPLPSQS